MKLSAIVFSAVLALGCAGARPSTWASPLVGRPVDVRAPDLQGRDHDVKLDAGKVRIVDFWATWCDPCRDQLPFLESLRARYGARGLAVYAISFDEDRNAVERFLSESPLSSTVLWDKGGAQNAERLQITRLPTTLIVDRNGTVREAHLGFEKKDEAWIEATVVRLLAE
jgi:cytochrome c biogenesis protein CcmG/thiol:disulfide interchange protein DsbE